MTQWEVLAKELKYADEQAMWVDLYTKRRLSLNQLSTKLACSVHTVRTKLRRFGIPLRQRGGPNSQKFEVTPELLERVEKLGIPKTAKLMGVQPQTLYQRLYYSKKLKVRDLEKTFAGSAEESAEENTTSPLPPTDTDE